MGSVIEVGGGGEGGGGGGAGGGGEGGGGGGGGGSAAHEYDALKPSCATLPSDVNCTVMLFPVDTAVGGNDVPVYRPSCALASTVEASNTYT
eukprot:COSAG02_NODE_13845_length_1339_cov_2.000806_2_plen_92_part_00